jgi:heme/copper-type cytochrome/quinol oxidase subunit 2
METEQTNKPENSNNSKNILIIAISVILIIIVAIVVVITWNNREEVTPTNEVETTSEKTTPATDKPVETDMDNQPSRSGPEVSPEPPSVIPTPSPENGATTEETAPEVDPVPEG